MLRRRQPVGKRGPGLVRTVGRTAVIAGTATAVSGAVAGKQVQRQEAAAQQAAKRQQLSELQVQVDRLQSREVEAQMTPATSAGAGEDLISQLARLGVLHRDGVLTADEFAAAKAKLLGS